MKKRFYKIALLASVLSMAMSVNVFAQNDNNVWIDEKDIECGDKEWKIKVESDGKSTDGLLVLTYNTSLLSVEETDVLMSDEVDMYSVNQKQIFHLKVY